MSSAEENRHAGVDPSKHRPSRASYHVSLAVTVHRLTSRAASTDADQTLQRVLERRRSKGQKPGRIDWHQSIITFDRSLFELYTNSFFWWLSARGFLLEKIVRNSCCKVLLHAACGARLTKDGGRNCVSGFGWFLPATYIHAVEPTAQCFLLVAFDVIIARPFDRTMTLYIIAIDDLVEKTQSKIYTTWFSTFPLIWRLSHCRRVKPFTSKC